MIIACFTYAYIKKNNTICENKCYDSTKYYRYWKLYKKNIEKNIEKKSYLISDCYKYTVSIMRCYSDYSDRFYSLNYWIRKKYEIKTFQPKIPEASISKLDNENMSIDFFGN